MDPAEDGLWTPCIVWRQVSSFQHSIAGLLVVFNANCPIGKHVNISGHFICPPQFMRDSRMSTNDFALSTARQFVYKGHP